MMIMKIKYNNISNIDNSEMIGNQIEKDQKEINEKKNMIESKILIIKRFFLNFKHI